MIGQEPNREQSEFNSAISYLNRLNALFYEADMAAMQLDIYNWFHALMAIYRELSTELKESEMEEYQKESRLIAEIVNQIMFERSRGRKGEITPETYDKVHLFEIKLRRLMRESGLQMKMKEDAMKALR